MLYNILEPIYSQPKQGKRQNVQKNLFLYKLYTFTLQLNDKINLIWVCTYNKLLKNL